MSDTMQRIGMLTGGGDCPGLQDYGINVLLVIGGDGTMRIAQELIQKGLQGSWRAQN